MTSLKKYWFGVTREYKPKCAEVYDSIESTSVTQSKNGLSLLEQSADCKQLLNHQCPDKSVAPAVTIDPETATQQTCPTDSSTMNAAAASSPSLISERTSQILPHNTLQKSTSRKKSLPGGKKSATDRKASATEKKGAAADKKGASTKGDKKTTEKKAPERKASEKKAPERKASDKKATERKVSDKKAPERKVSEKKAPERKVSEKKTPAAKTTAATAKKGGTPKKSDEPKTPKSVVGEEGSPKGAKAKPAAAKETPSTAAAKGSAKKSKAGPAAEEPGVGEEMSPKDKGAGKKGKGAKPAAGAKEPKLGEAASPGQPKGKGATDGEQPVGRKPGSPRGGGRPTRRRMEDVTTKKVIIETPATTVSSLYTPRRKPEKRKPFSRPLTFSSRASTVDSLSEFDRSQSIAHEEHLQRVWRLMHSRLFKTVPTPIGRSVFLKDPPEMGYGGTLTVELRKDYAKRKIEAMQKPSMELVRNPLMLRFIQPKMNKSEILRKKHIKKETIMSTYFEQHYERFQKPPFRTNLLARKCSIW